ncbi:histidine kinase [Undibacterium sp.]|uniref:sensor histidine kinase n=1 Tax=Undibacterium sp. TaxID=1914977 RepID=UPI0025EB3574|nr:histidine kinase [Undibacterium sp.]
MIKKIKLNRIAAIGVAASLILGGFEFFEVYLGGVSKLDLHMPLGVIASLLANFFVSSAGDPASAISQQVFAYHFMWICRVLSTFIFATSFWYCNDTSRHSSVRQIKSIFLVQLLIGVSGLSSLLCILAAEFALLLPWRQAQRWLGLQMISYAVIHLYYLFGYGLLFSRDEIEIGLFFLLAQCLLYFICFIAVYGLMRERRRSLNLSASHAQLLATQAMLGDAVRASERIRISRDLHDIIGHHLTALNLHLDLAQRQAHNVNGADLQTSLGIARELAQALLSEVRGVVSIERQQQKIDLAYALETLCAGVPRPAITLELDKTLEIDSAVLAHTLFCCVQESITNCVRHANATTLHIKLEQDDLAIRVAITDNGIGRRTQSENNGLRGMRERLEQIGGQLILDNLSEGGFRLVILIPRTTLQVPA